MDDASDPLPVGCRLLRLLLEAPMETIPHRELRNHSSEILARVSKGESIAVTNHGDLPRFSARHR